jgi:hypothetical protein
MVRGPGINNSSWMDGGDGRGESMTGQSEEISIFSGGD